MINTYMHNQGFVSNNSPNEIKISENFSYPIKGNRNELIKLNLN